MGALLEKFPFKLALVVYAASLWFRFDAFETDPASEYVSAKQQLTTAEATRKDLDAKLKAAREFYRTLELKKAEVQVLARQLADAKAVLPETLDTPGFMKSVITEANRVGLKVLSIKPKDARKEEYYAEQAFEMSFHGVYAQLVIFFERLSSMQNIVRIDDFNIKRDGSPVAPYVEVNGDVQLKAYRYVGSKADEIGNRPSAPPPGAPTSSAPAAAAPATAPAPAAPAAAPAAPEAKK